MFPTTLPTNSYVPLDIITVAGLSGKRGCQQGSTNPLQVPLYNPTDVLLDGFGGLYFTDSGNGLVYFLSSSSVLSVYAGGGYSYTNSNGYRATLYRLYSPQFLLADASGNIYFTEQWSHVVRKVTKSTGIMTIFAGAYNVFSATPSGDGGQATAAKLYYPSGLAIDSSGSIYISNFGNGVIRKVTTAGVISTYKSGFNGPQGMQMDSSNKLFLADTYNNRIVKIDTSLSVTVVAGYVSGSLCFNVLNCPATSVSLSFPTDVALDPNGVLYFSDSFSNTIRKVVSGVLSTYAGVYYRRGMGCIGSCTYGFELLMNDPRGLTYEASTGDIYFADSDNQAIAYITTSTVTDDNNDDNHGHGNGRGRGHGYGHRYGDSWREASISYYVIIGIISFTFLFGYLRSNGMAKKYFIILSLPTIELALIYLFVFQLFFYSNYMMYLLMALFVLPGVYLIFDLRVQKNYPVALRGKTLLSRFSPDDSSSNTIPSWIFTISCVVVDIINIPFQLIVLVIGSILFQTSLWSVNRLWNKWMLVWSQQALFDDHTSIDELRISTSLLSNVYMKSLPQLFIQLVNVYLLKNSPELSANVVYISIALALSLVNVLNVLYYFYIFKPSMEKMKEDEKMYWKNEGAADTNSNGGATRQFSIRSISSGRDVPITTEIHPERLLHKQLSYNLSSMNKRLIQCKKCYDMLQLLGHHYPSIVDILSSNDINDVQSLFKNMTTSIRNDILLAIPSQPPQLRHSVMAILSNFCVDIQQGIQQKDKELVNQYKSTKGQSSRLKSIDTDIRMMSTSEHDDPEHYDEEWASDESWDESDLNAADISQILSNSDIQSTSRYMDESFGVNTFEDDMVFYSRRDLTPINQSNSA